MTAAEDKDSKEPGKRSLEWSSLVINSLCLLAVLYARLWLLPKVPAGLKGYELASNEALMSMQATVMVAMIIAFIFTIMSLFETLKIRKKFFKNLSRRTVGLAGAAVGIGAIYWSFQLYFTFG